MNGTHVYDYPFIEEQVTFELADEPVRLPVVRSKPVRPSFAFKLAISLAFYALIALLAFALSGCSAVSPEEKKQIQRGAAVGDGELADWAGLDDEAKKEDYWKAIRILHDLDFSLFGTPIPKAFEQDPWAKTPRVPGADASAAGGGK